MRPSLTHSRLSKSLVLAAFLAAPIVMHPVFDSAPAQAQPLGAPETFADLVEAVKPGVVTITTRASVTGPDFGAEGPLRDFMERFFGQQPDFGRPTPRREAQGLGSGFIISEDGVVITNNHVVDNADEVAVRLDNGDEVPATLVGVDPKTDLAVLQIESDRDLRTIEWGDSDTLRVGDWVVAIGNPFGLGGSVTAGIVSARGRDINSGPYDDFIQIDAAINRGNSGGPLFNMDGRVIGVNTAIFSPNGGNIGLGFAIPSNQARDIVEQLLDSGKVERGRIGVAIQPVTSDIAEGLGLDDARGALVASVDEAGPAAAAGVQRGDVIIGYAGLDIDTVRDLTRAVAATAPGRSESLTVWRRGAEERLEVVVGAMEATEAAAVFEEPMLNEPALGGADLTVASIGVELRDLDDMGRAEFNIGADVEGALVVSVEAGGSAASVEIRRGDVIVAVGQIDVDGAEAVGDLIAEAAAEGRQTVPLLIAREGDTRYVAVKIADS